MLTTSSQTDFCLDVLDILKRRKVTFRGLDPWYIVLYIDGAVGVWFQGLDKTGKATSKKVSMICNTEIKDAIHLGKPEVIAEVIEFLIDHNSARFY